MTEIKVRLTSVRNDYAGSVMKDNELALRTEVALEGKPELLYGGSLRNNSLAAK